MSLVYDGYSQEQLDGLLNTRLLVPDFETSTDRFTERSEATRRNVSAQLDIAYGGHPRERLDVFLPDAVASPPVNLFFHGGYWRSSDKERYSFLAESFLSFGAACITVEYALVPAVSLDELVAQCRRSVAYVWQHGRELGIDPDRIYVSGHSAGGQIVGMLMASGWRDEYGIPAESIRGGCGISGLYDLEPIRHSYLQPTLQLDPESVRRNSVALLEPATDAPLIAAVGALEGEEFLRQNALMAAAWGDRVAVTSMVLDGLHHYSAVEALADASSELAIEVRRQMTVSPSAAGSAKPVRT
jgi:arylformamidase